MRKLHGASDSTLQRMLLLSILRPCSYPKTMAVKHATMMLTTIPAETSTKNMHILHDKLAKQELLKGHVEAAPSASLWPTPVRLASLRRSIMDGTVLRRLYNMPAASSRRSPARPRSGAQPTSNGRESFSDTQSGRRLAGSSWFARAKLL